MGQVVSQDLVNLVPGHLALLYHVSRAPELTSPGFALQEAISRYRNFLFLRKYDLAQHTSLAIEWIWHVHRLHPVHYMADCNRTFGELIPSQYKKMNPKEEDLKLVEYFDMEFNQVKEMPPQHQNVVNNFAFSFDIIAAVCRQKSFVDKAVVFYDCTRKNFEKFQKDYKMFLELLNQRPSRLLVSYLFRIRLLFDCHMYLPSQLICSGTQYDFQLFSRAKSAKQHMRIIEVYEKDTRRLFGKILDHDDDLPQQQLDECLNYTIRLWRQTYGKVYIKDAKYEEYKIRRYRDSYDNGSLFVIGVWGYPYYIPPCHNSTWNWDGHCDPGHGNVGDMAPISEGPDAACGGGVSCGGSTCGGGTCTGGGASCGGGDIGGGGSSCGGGDGGGSSCGGGGCGGGCGG